ncbi:MAG TPA: GntR family transcriptional regulator [Ensifer sp.]|uniref:GntR family transcriptional regulator n=1 Tax=Ensifer sp. TaxID=1872086 RepID=UPI002E0F339D|nr:GntR family transcriptional regulator [Ensifer sp.]
MQAEDAASMQYTSLSGIEAKIHVDLWNAIIDRKLKPGVKLEELVMCDIYGISRTVMRKVLMIMEQDGLVFLPPNKGAYVASPSLQSAFEMLELSEALQTFVVDRIAANRASIPSAQLDRLAQHTKAEEKAETAHDFRMLRRLDIEFGILLCLVHGNGTLAREWERNASCLALALSLHQSVQPAGRQSGFSRQMLERLAAGDATGAVALVRERTSHLKSSLDTQPDDENVNLREILGLH